MQTLRLPKIQEEFGLKKTAIYTLIKERGFPKPIKLSDRIAVWDREAIEKWIKSHANQKAA